MSSSVRSVPYEVSVPPPEVLWDTWVRAEMATEMALYVWRTAPVAERATAHDEYAARLVDEERAATLLHRALSSRRRTW